MSRSETPENGSLADETRELPASAQRALAEAEERRRKRDAEAQPREKELGGTEGLDPVRYGDWENGGIASDF